MKLKPYTVVLLYPRDMCDGGTQTYLAWVDSPNAEFAIDDAKDQAEAANQGNVKAEDFEALYVFAGHIEAEWSEMP